MHKLLFLTTLLAFLLTSTVWAADISGTWAVTVKSPLVQDDWSFDLAIKADGNNLTVSCSNAPLLKTLEGAGTLKGDEIKMDLTSTSQETAGIKIILTGKITGNKMAGTEEVDISGMSADAEGFNMITANPSGSPNDKIVIVGGKLPRIMRLSGPSGDGQDISNTWTAMKK